MTTTIRSRAVSLLLAGIAALAVALLAVAAPARAIDTPGSQDDGGQTGLVGTCVATAGPNYLGVACPGGGDDTGPVRKPPYFLCPPPKSNDRPKNFQKVCEKPPTCWNSDALSDDELKAAGVTNSPGPGGITWYWTRCLRGIGEDLVDRGGTVIQKPYPRPNSSIDELVGINQPQRDLVTYYFSPENGGRRPPDPLIGTSPNPNPRVRTDVSFYDENETGTSVAVSAGDVQLMAVEDRIEVSVPGGGGTKTCGRQGAQNPNDAGFDPKAAVGYEAREGETRATVGDKGCWYLFQRSSADQDGNTFQAPATSHWTVWQKVGDAPWGSFQGVEFDKDGVSPIVVTEVQSINLPFSRGE